MLNFLLATPLSGVVSFGDAGERRRLLWNALGTASAIIYNNPKTDGKGRVVAIANYKNRKSSAIICNNRRQTERAEQLRLLIIIDHFSKT
jgi:hypothetical protein